RGRPRWNGGRRSVDRVEDPPTLGVWILHSQLFAEDSVVRETRLDPLASPRFRLAVCDGDRRTIALGLDRQRFSKMSERDVARAPCHFGNGLHQCARLVLHTTRLTAMPLFAKERLISRTELLPSSTIPPTTAASAPPFSNASATS